RIRPHFLFNSMNLIASLLHRDPAVAERAVLDLSDLFRAALGAGEGDSTLRDECELAERYLSIESLRLGERLQVRWQ
ncbi:sensor histidine kinase, partial [Enterobacter hormaechei]|uniref:sensor histidine kinase n=2 Tax=Gammaproteobacteria TaxID=1236 RepID=UPI00203D6E4F